MNKATAKPAPHIKCQYPACKVTFAAANPTGLCEKHRGQAAFLVWFLEKKLRLGGGGPSVVELLLAAMNHLVEAQEKTEVMGEATLFSFDGKKLR